MTAQEVIKIIQFAKQSMRGEYDQEGLNMAIDMIKKQIPKNPKDIEYDLSFFQCSNCGQVIYSENEITEHKYCLNCGQAISWEVGNDDDC